MSDDASVKDEAGTEQANGGESVSPRTSPQRETSREEHRVWFLTDGTSPLAVTLARVLLGRGDSVVAGIAPHDSDVAPERVDKIEALLEENEVSGGQGRLRLVTYDMSSVSDCQSTAADAVNAFGHVDVLLCCSSEALFGSIEELARSKYTESLVLEQFMTNFFSTVNIIRAFLPYLRAQKKGHVILLSGITAHLGTPGLSMYCASQWAIEGYCDSLAYEVAPFNTKVSIVQSTIEISVLTHKITSVPPMGAYSAETNPAPLSRKLFAGLLDKLNEAVMEQDGLESTISTNSTPGSALLSNKITSMYPLLPASFEQSLVAETVHALVAIGGHENPPARHIVGHEGVTSVKEKLKTVSEELEDFVEVSASVDI